MTFLIKRIFSKRLNSLRFEKKLKKVSTKKKKKKLKRFPSNSRILIIIFAKITSGKTIPSICPKSVTYEIVF
jgi:hypothetical protein